LGGLRASLQDAAYTQDSLNHNLGIQHPDDVGALNQEPARLRLEGEKSTLASAIRLFFLEADEDAAAASRLLSARGLSQLTSAGLLQRRQGKVRARLRIDPIGEQVFLADRRFRASDRTAFGLGLTAPGGLRAGTRIDPVYPPSADSIILRDAIIQPDNGKVLDLCTGSGVQAVAHAHSAHHVTAVDINPRAVATAELNVILNGVDNVEVCQGDLYAAVRRRRFDTIIANPPFVSSPYAKGPSYHAGGPSGDAVLRRILRGWAKHLEPDGRGFAITHVGLRNGQELLDLAGSWLHGFPGRVLLLELESGSPVDLAAAQALFALEQGLSTYNREVRRWVAYLMQHRIARITAVLIVAERSGVPSFDLVDARTRILPLPVTPPPRQRVVDWFTNR